MPPEPATGCMTESLRIGSAASETGEMTLTTGKKSYVGKNRSETLDWLSKAWLEQGPPVCYLQGSPGVGKTDLARDFRALVDRQRSSDNKRRWQQAVINELPDCEVSVVGSLMELSITLSQQGLPEMEQVLLAESDSDPAHALEMALQKPVVIIIDEAQRFFLPDSSVPMQAWKKILAHLGNRQDLPGRLLLLSDRIVERARWSEWISRRILDPLTPEEAVRAFDIKLAEAGLEIEIAPERKAEVVQDLGCNPRAIESLVGALQYETLDSIIESDPGLWAVRDREVSRDFLQKLERNLLDRTMRHLSPEHQHKLWRLAVYRRSFDHRALDMVSGSKEEAVILRQIYVTRFLLKYYNDHYKNWLTLNPIVREISLAHLKDNPSEFRKAHSRAADYHMRYFKARKIVSNSSQLSNSFAELRYHLFQAERYGELEPIIRLFTAHLIREIESDGNLPSGEEELAERIGVLNVLLKTEGAPKLEYHMARCLDRRRQPGDLKQAVSHAQRAVGPHAGMDAWRLLIDLTFERHGIEPALKVIDRAITTTRRANLLSRLYKHAAWMLADADRIEEAIAWVSRGVESVPPEQDCAVLHTNRAFLMARIDRIDEALALLEEGIGVIPPEYLQTSLYQAMSDLYLQKGRADEAIRIMTAGYDNLRDHHNGYRLIQGSLLITAAMGTDGDLERIVQRTSPFPLPDYLVSFGSVLLLQLRDEWGAAADLAAESVQRIHDYFPMRCLWSFSCLAAGDTDTALKALTDSPRLDLHIGLPHIWFMAFIHLRKGDRENALEMLEIYLGRPVDESRELNETFLLRLWDQQAASTSSRRLCYHYPIMPASISGAATTVRRILYQDPVLPGLQERDAGAKPAPPAPAAPPRGSRRHRDLRLVRLGGRRFGTGTAAGGDRGQGLRDPRRRRSHRRPRQGPHARRGVHRGIRPGDRQGGQDHRRDQRQVAALGVLHGARAVQGLSQVRFQARGIPGEGDRAGHGRRLAPSQRQHVDHRSRQEMEGSVGKVLRRPARSGSQAQIAE